MSIATENRRAIKTRFKQLKAMLYTIVEGTTDDVRQLRFAEVYSHVYNLVVMRKGKKLLVRFKRMVEVCAATHCKKKETYDLKSQMLIDVHMFAIKTRFGGIGFGDDDVAAAVAAAWVAVGRRTSLRSAFR